MDDGAIIPPWMISPMFHHCCVLCSDLDSGVHSTLHALGHVVRSIGSRWCVIPWEVCGVLYHLKHVVCYTTGSMTVLIWFSVVGR